MEQNLSYEAAYKELKAIATDIENETVTVDVLAVKVKRAAELISFCQKKLRDTEAEVTNIIKEMEANSGKP